MEDMTSSAFPFAVDTNQERASFHNFSSAILKDVATVHSSEALMWVTGSSGASHSSNLPQPLLSPPPLPHNKTEAAAPGAPTPL